MTHPWAKSGRPIDCSRWMTERMARHRAEKRSSEMVRAHRLPLTFAPTRAALASA